jgi:hypothetical protein
MKGSLNCVVSVSMTEISRRGGWVSACGKPRIISAKTETRSILLGNGAMREDQVRTVDPQHGCLSCFPSCVVMSTMNQKAVERTPLSYLINFIARCRRHFAPSAVVRFITSTVPSVLCVCSDFCHSRYCQPQPGVTISFPTRTDFAV